MRKCTKYEVTEGYKSTEKDVIRLCNIFGERRIYIRIIVEHPEYGNTQVTLKLWDDRECEPSD